MTSSIGNDTTCRASAPPSNPFKSTDLSSYVPPLPCYTQAQAATLFRSATYTQTATITGAVISGTLMQVTVQTGNPIYTNAVIGGGTVAANTAIVRQVSGTAGGTGFYEVSISQSATADSAVLTSGVATSDWFLTKKGTNWDGMITSNNLLVGGKSDV
jgi:hypothetical protein